MFTVRNVAIVIAALAIIFAIWLVSGCAVSPAKPAVGTGTQVAGASMDPEYQEMRVPTISGWSDQAVEAGDDQIAKRTASKKLLDSQHTALVAKHKLWGMLEAGDPALHDLRSHSCVPSPIQFIIPRTARCVQWEIYTEPSPEISPDPPPATLNLWIDQEEHRILVGAQKPVSGAIYGKWKAGSRVYVETVAGQPKVAEVRVYSDR